MYDSINQYHPSMLISVEKNAVKEFNFNQGDSDKKSSGNSASQNSIQEQKKNNEKIDQHSQDCKFDGQETINKDKNNTTVTIQIAEKYFLDRKKTYKIFKNLEPIF